MKTRSCVRRAALLAGLATLAVTGTASAESIAFVRGGDIYLSTPDGARQFRVTSTGDYSAVSQADNGTIIGTVGTTAETLRKLDRLGNVQAEFKTPVSDGPPPKDLSNYFYGPYDAVVSPDGSKVAYQYYWQHYTYIPGGCGGVGCYGERLESGTAITYPDRLTPWSEFGVLTGWGSPQWLGNDRLVRSNAGVPLAEDVVVNRIAKGLGDDDLSRWVNDATDGDFGDVSRDGKKLVLVDMIDSKPGLKVYDASKGQSVAPQACYRLNFPNTTDKVGRSAWSPDGKRLVFEVNGSLSIVNVPALAGCNGTDIPVGAETEKPFLAKASSPSWGLAGVPTSRPVTTPPVPAPPASRPPKGGGPRVVPGTLRATLTPATLRKALKQGVTVRYTAPSAGTVRLVSKAGRKTVATGRGKAARAGAATVKLRFKKAAVKSLKRKRRVTLAVRLTFTGGVSQALTVTVKR